MSVLVIAAFGALAGGGAAVVTRSFRQSQLAGAIGRLGNRNNTAAPQSTSPWRHLSLQLARRGSDRLATDLTILGRDPLAHAAARLRNVVVVLVGVAVFLVVTTTSGRSANPLLVLVVGGLSACVALYLPNQHVATQAARRRSDAVAALSSYLDLVTVLLAGGAGLETALHGAAQAGDGWMFNEIRATLVRARTTRSSVWDEYAALGDRVGIPQLVELGASVQLAGRQGARVADSLAARAQSLRSHVLAGIEADAAAATERMGLPTVLLFAGFLFLLGYPAAQIILAAT